jgi:hypothetical protein
MTKPVEAKPWESSQKDFRNLHHEKHTARGDSCQ